ncbi:bifunctional phosphoribosylaminoimidazolecarboxamide formyltransferase/IMP cyclohydrolase [Actinomyces weissii]|uniref:Bifunctional purine biosynthesis protein PurH n=1 Tax=Actinomyces weissii TaxID=675090 RepID=A0A7T7M8L5_9ACTO|nr:bifunctional phosphoribosylaminoimidazolecarboxamide formyltransferase/IMP cyclohydrolase [Actinomyces weissii]QQM66906.1 bifunctional phosphoribosylaminoimidazolecarboxamide formyltransferase/IMP cyclohydrolase [Actinomyces weissii]
MSLTPATHPAEPTEPLGQVPVKRALLSVYDKTGLVGLATALHAAGVELVATGSSAAALVQAGLPVTGVEQVTGFPECLDGRVKTLHPRLHAGILADRRRPSHLSQLAGLEVTPIDLVVVNLYPFTETVRSGAPFDACVEQIDIGGPSLVRAAAKNHAAVAVVTDPAGYDQVVQAVASGGFHLQQRRALAARAFAYTAAYDAAVATWFAQQADTAPETASATPPDTSPDAAGHSPQAARAPLPAYLGLGYERLATLRYGENPHQRAAVYTLAGQGGGVANARQIHGKAMSCNNYTDTDAAVRAAYDHPGLVTVAVIKHANPCGIAVSASGDVAEAHRKAHACDPVSAYGGVVATNAPVTVAMAQQVKQVFTEVVAAPAFEPEAVEILRARKNLRLLVVEPPARDGWELRQVSGGAVVQERDTYQGGDDDPATWQLACGEPVDPGTLADLVFAWRSVRAVRSNAVLLAHDGATVGVGMGQVNRVDSCRLAVERANTLGRRTTGDAAASDPTAASPAGAPGSSDTSASGSAAASSAPAAQADAVEQPGATAPQRARGSVAASDAFFPFADGLQVLAEAGVKAVVQPGGSIRDEEVVAAARQAGVTMYLTGVRHFAH